MNSYETRKQVRQREAIERQAEHDKLTNKQKYEKLKTRGAVCCDEAERYLIGWIKDNNKKDIEKLKEKSK